MIYKPFSIVVVPFPFTDSSKKKKRPALVISTEKYQKESGHAIMMMITSAKHSKWYGDHLIQDLKSTKLPVESYVRQKLFTLDLRIIEKSLGMLPKGDIDKVKSLLRESVSFL